MKAKFPLFILGITTSILHAQILNNSFEENNQCNLSTYWSYIPLQAIIIDSSGHEVEDSIIWDCGVHALNCPVFDAHTGSQAISLRNAYHYNSGQMLIGRSTLFPDSSECTTFFQTLLPINYDPQNFSFYYKFAPINGDTAYAIAVLYDQWGTELAKAEKLIIGAQSSYVQDIIPFVYLSPDSVAFYSISFYNMIADGYPHQSTFGTRFTIDDVAFGGNMSISNNDDEINVSVFPNPAKEIFNIQPEINVTISNVSIITIHGQSIPLAMNGSLQYDCSSIPKGVYHLKIITDKGVSYKKLIKD